MSTFIRWAIFAAAVLAGLSAAYARYGNLEDNGRTTSEYDLNNPDDVWEFWEVLQGRGGRR
jgi:hypothetical protein